MTGEQVPNVPAPESAPEVQVRDLTDEEIMERAKQINEAREIERQEELKRAEAVKKAEEAQKAAKIAEAERLKKLEEEKKAEELKRARAMVREDDERRAAEEKAAQPKKKHTGLKIFLVIIVILLIAFGITIASHGVTNDVISGTATLPYQSTYNIWLPQGETSVAGMTFTAVGDDSSVKLSIPGLPTQTLNKGQTTAPISHKMTLTLLWGAWKVMEINYSAELTYKGLTTENLLAFGAVIKTDRQIPEWLLDIGLSLSKIQYSRA
ncbi:MAG TPA: hypothetical protein O0X19_04075 [Methanocorpusculum sp.]|nr:hypothetical protein [Candidatus Methanocorpusculum equi]HJJ33538.1 hypothetical protein [Methanocorpusculum sp.]